MNSRWTKAVHRITAMPDAVAAAIITGTTTIIVMGTIIVAVSAAWPSCW